MLEPTFMVGYAASVRRMTDGDGRARQVGVREVSRFSLRCVPGSLERLKHGWLVTPSQRKKYGCLRCTSGVVDGVAWTKWLMIDLRNSHVVSVFLGNPFLYKSLAKWSGYAAARGRLPDLSLSEMAALPM
uniref:Uncharacterized protein n=1 Tax=Candidatus Kentrum sp. TC TaxID=2126339 RepID=A0A450Z593_9GAMM|nr:MAG: hypothetical protein BECKTC1821E_GA0114239_11493 [Candidatus Kentron sp. TC]